MYSIDEKTGLTAQESLRVQGMMPGMIERRDPEYKRHGMIHMIAALDFHTGDVKAMFMSTNNNPRFLDFLEQVEQETPGGHDIYIVLDNLSTHTSKKTREWLTRHPRIKLDFTPVKASWLNQIELWLSTFTRQFFKRNNFQSIEDLIDKAFTYFKEYNKTAKPYAWIYKGKPLKR